MADGGGHQAFTLRGGRTWPARTGRLRRECPTNSLGLILALLQAPLVGQGQERPDSAGEIRVMASRELSAAASSMADIAAEPREWLGLGLVDVTPLTLVVVPDVAGFSRWSQGRVPQWGAGMTVPSRRLVVIRFDAGPPLKTLRHELAHLAFHTRIATRVPLWFSEGYAALAAGEHGRLDALQLNLSVALGRVPDLRELDAALRGGSGDAGPAYALAADAVADIARRHPTGTLTPILARLQAGESFSAALEASTGLDPDSFDERWRRAVRGRYNLGIWTVTGGAWLVVVLVLWVAAALRRARDAPRRLALDDGWPAPPPEDAEETDNGMMTTGLEDGNALDPRHSDR